MFRTAESFAAGAGKPRAKIIPALHSQLEGWIRDGHPLPERVFLCFTSDPYQPAEAEHRLTRQAIEMLNAYDVAVMILTKAGELAVRDLDLLARRPRNAFGVSLTARGMMRAEWEPAAASFMERADNLREAHAAGVFTWASVEPVLDLAASLDMIRLTLPHCDHYKIGRLNHMGDLPAWAYQHVKHLDIGAKGPDPQAARLLWRKFRDQAVALIEGAGRTVMVKQSLVGV
jgi:hypothetical protein